MNNQRRKFIIKRVIKTIPIIIGVTLIAFLILHLGPGDPARIMLGSYASQENIDAVRAKYNLDKPLYVQYTTWVFNITKGDFGKSMRYDRDVLPLILGRLKPTIILTGSGLLIALILGTSLGILAAIKKNSWIDYVCTFQAMLWLSFPAFWLGVLLLYLFGLKLRLVPIAGLAGFSSVILPALTIGLRQEAWFARPMRAEMLEVLNQNYIKVARAKGIKKIVVIGKHALRNALIPIITMLALRLPWIIGGSVVVEIVFGWSGIGTLLVNSVLSRDFPMVQAILLFISIAVVLANLLADILYSYFDPRINLEV